MPTIYIRVKELLDERGWTQKQLAVMTGIRPAAISELCNNLRTSINRDHLERIACVLGLTDIRQLVELKPDRPAAQIGTDIPGQKEQEA